MANNIIDGNNSADKIYKRTGFSATVSDSFSSPTTGPTDVEWDGADVHSAESVNNKLYRHTGFSSTISSSLSGQSTQTNGVSRREDGLFEASAFTDKIYLHTGLTSSIKSSISSPATSVYGVAWGHGVFGGNNLLSSDSVANKNYVNSGFSSTVSNSYNAGNVATGVTWDGTDLYGQQAQSGSEKHLKFSGLSATISSSYTVTSGNRGITIDQRTLPADWNVALGTATAEGLAPTTDVTPVTREVLWSWLNTHVRHRIRR